MNTNVSVLHSPRCRSGLDSELYFPECKIAPVRPEGLLLSAFHPSLTHPSGKPSGDIVQSTLYLHLTGSPTDTPVLVTDLGGNSVVLSLYSKLISSRVGTWKSFRGTTKRTTFQSIILGHKRFQRNRNSYLFLCLLHK